MSLGSKTFPTFEGLMLPTVQCIMVFGVIPFQGFYKIDTVGLFTILTLP